MAPAFTETDVRSHLTAICPVIDNVRRMVGAARHAFNRHSPAELEELHRLFDLVAIDLEMALEDVEADLEKPGAGDNPHLSKLKEVYTHLLFVGDHTKAMADPIRKKMQECQIFPDQDFMHINDLFAHLTGLLRTLVDIFKTDDPGLKKYLLKECDALTSGCFTAETEHEARMTTSFGQPHAWGVYLGLLDLTRKILARFQDLVKLLGAP